MATRNERKMVRKIFKMIGQAYGVPNWMFDHLPDNTIDSIIQTVGTNTGDLENYIKNILTGGKSNPNTAPSPSQPQSSNPGAGQQVFVPPTKALILPAILSSIGTAADAGFKVAGAWKGANKEAMAGMLNNIMQEKHITPSASQKAAAMMAPYAQGRAAFDKYAYSTIGNAISNIMNSFAGKANMSSILKYAADTDSANNAMWDFLNRGQIRK